MTRDYANYKRKRQRQTRRGLILFLLLAFFAVLPGIALYQYRHELSFAALKEEASQKLAVYFPHLQKDKEKEKKLLPAKKVAAKTQESVKPIHFDFYDELPKAQLDLPQEQLAEEDEAEEEPKVSVAAVKKPLAPPAPAPAQAPAPAPAAVVATSAPAPVPVSAPAPEVNKHEEEVVQELASDLSSMKAAETGSPYIIQLSIFHSLGAAKRYRAALASAGLKVDLVKLRLGREVVYRLQQGPYTNMDQLKLAKKRLTERGVACDIRKLPPYMM